LKAGKEGGLFEKKVEKRGKKGGKKRKIEKKVTKRVLYKHINSACLTGGGRQKMGDRCKIPFSK
jgi:hypothetical protein